MFLTEQQLIEMTGHRRRDAQQRALNSMGIVHRVRPDGSLAVHSEHVQSVFGVLPSKIERTHEINMSAI